MDKLNEICEKTKTLDTVTINRRDYAIVGIIMEPDGRILLEATPMSDVVPTASPFRTDGVPYAKPGRLGTMSERKQLCRRRAAKIVELAGGDDLFDGLVERAWMKKRLARLAIKYIALLLEGRDSTEITQKWAVETAKLQAVRKVPLHRPTVRKALRSVIVQGASLAGVKRDDPTLVTMVGPEGD